MSSAHNQITLTLPKWAADFERDAKAPLSGLEERMRLVINLARLNVENGSGGPFGAAVFERESGRLIAVGVNLVISAGLSMAHAEMVALSLAQSKVGTFTLRTQEGSGYQLVVNAQPCAMCAGAIPWSGVSEVVFAASKEQVEKMTGFDEGALHPQWREEFQKRKIAIVEGLLNEEALAALELYRKQSGVIYNGQ